MSQECTIELVSLALDAALMRQTAIATNIANINTQNYQPIGVRFEEQLNQLSSASLSSLKPTFEPIDSHASIDEQIALSVKNTMQYHALIKGLNHKLAIMSLALQGNNAS